MADSVTLSTCSQSTDQHVSVDRIANYCCFLQSVDTGAHGSGFIVEFEGLRSVELFALNWKKRSRIGELQTNYALITSHDTIPGLSLSDCSKNRWTVSCQGIAKGDEQKLSELVCGVISCCGDESLFGIPHGDVSMFLAHPNVSCKIEFNVTILFLNSTFEKLRMLQEECSGCTVSPPVITVEKYLDQDAFAQRHKQVISATQHSVHVYYSNGPKSYLKTAVSVHAEQQDTASEHNEVLSRDIAKFEMFQKLHYRESSSSEPINSPLIERCYGSPVVYHNPATDEQSIAGVHVGETEQKGEYYAVTFYGILQMLQGGLVPVLSVLHCYKAPRAWTSRWAYLVTPHIDQRKQTECGYVCEVLHFLLKKRIGTQLVKLSVDLVDVDNEASLDLLCALFKHIESADEAALDEALSKPYGECHNWRVDDAIKKLCGNLLNLLEGAVSEPKQKETICMQTKTVALPADRTSFVEKCCIFYNRLLNIKYAGITKQILCTSENLELLRQIQQRYKHSDVVQKNAVDISLKCGCLQNADESSLSNIGLYLSGKELLALKVILHDDVIDCLKQKGLDLTIIGNVQTTLEEVQRLLHSLGQHEIASSLQQHLHSALENQLHYEAYQRALKEEHEIRLKYLKVLFFGPPRTGKTSMRRRLVGEILNLANEPVQPSTGTAEHHDVIVKVVEETVQGDTEPYDSIVKVVEDKTTTLQAVIKKSKWSTIKALFGQEKSTHEKDLDEELRLIYQFIYTDAVPRDANISTVSDSVKEEAQDEAFEEEISANQAKSKVKTDAALIPVLVESSKADPNASISQEVSLVREPRYGLSAKQMEEIEKVYEAFDKILRTPGQEQLKVLLDETILMNMVDTGGHPAFLEMLPALTMGPALYLIFFRLNQELKKIYQIHYVSKDTKEVPLGDSSYTVEEVIYQALSSIACFSGTAPKKASTAPMHDNINHAAMLIGTHKDLLKNHPETEIKDKDEALKHSLQEILENDIFEPDKDFLHHASDDQLMFAIDNMTGGEAELTEVRKRLEAVINQMFNNFPIPASWLMFSIFLRKMGKRTLSLLQCREIGARLQVKNTDEALWFLHHRVGILMHFSGIEEIKDLVICDHQVVLDSVTNLILNSFNLEQVSKGACDKFKETGQFRFKNILKIEKHLSNDGLPLRKLVKLLEHLNIIAPIKPESPSTPSHSQTSSLPRTSSQPDATEEEELVYFMPAVLKHAKEKELQMEENPTDPIPLTIHFKCGFVPVGVFCAMIASLVAQKDSLEWILMKPRKHRSKKMSHILRKNRATFRIFDAYDVTLISKPKQYEIHITSILTSDKSLVKTCEHVLETVCDTLDLVISKMMYKEYPTSLPSDQTCYELGFKCPEHPNGDHLVINRPKKGIKTLSQSAKSLWSLYLEGKSTMVCLEEERGIVFESFSQQNRIWFRESPVLSDSMHSKDISHGMHITGYLSGFEVCAETSFVIPVGHSYGFKWQRYGLKLYIPEGAVPLEHPECKVDIKAGFAGQFNIPNDLHLVSCVYWLSCPIKFVEPVTLEIEHCASLQDSSQSSSLRFIAAQCSQAELPYQFKVLVKGIFKPKSSYGSIQVSQFSFFAIGIFKKSQSLQRYFCTHHYIRKEFNQWDVDFIITSDLQASLTVIQDRYSRFDTISGHDFEVQFQKNTIQLAIPRTGLYLNGWKISPLGPSVITKQQVDTFKPGQQGQQGQQEKRVPYCRLQITLMDRNPTELVHHVELQGAKSPFDFFTITCPPKKYVERSAQAVGERRQPQGNEQGVQEILGKCNESSSFRKRLAWCLDPEVQEETEILSIENLKDITSYLNPLDKTAIIHLGIVLGLNYNRLKTMMDTPTFLSEMLAKWLERVDQVLQTGSPTWKWLVKALRDPIVGQNGLASRIEQDKQID